MEPRLVASALRARIRNGFLGQPSVVDHLLAALGAGLHVLLEGPPGTAKTLLAWSIAHAIGGRFARVQLTPDLMPSDLLGTSVWLPNEGRFDFREGPMFTDVLLADELNRAPPKTQAALLEAMQERRITLDGQTRELGAAFWVVATQNPLEQEGTYPLPESELDRFALKIDVAYPEASDELELLRRHRDRGDPMEEMRGHGESVVAAGAFAAWRQHVDRVHVDDAVVEYIRALVRATREQADLAWGGGPRAGIALLRCARGMAVVRERSYVIPDDIQELAPSALRHRIRLAPEAQVAGMTLDAVLERLLSAVPVPTGGATDASGR